MPSEVDSVSEVRTWTLIGADGRPYQSERPGSLGGHRARKLYGLFTCPSALRAILRGGYVKNRVFFRDEATAVAAGYRPCAVCLPEKYAAWKVARATKPTTGKETSHPSRATKPVILRSRIDASKGKLQKLGEYITGRFGQDRYLARLSGR
jgi:hypothetical protein